MWIENVDLEKGGKKGNYKACPSLAFFTGPLKQHGVIKS